MYYWRPSVDYTPTSNFILVDPVESKERENVTASGIIVNTKEERHDLIVAEGTVLDVGPDVVGIQKGDKILYNYFAGNTYKLFGDDPMGNDDKDYHLLWAAEVMAVHRAA